jgi:hypothetical protein
VSNTGLFDFRNNRGAADGSCCQHTSCAYPLGDLHSLKWLHETPQKPQIREPGLTTCIGYWLLSKVWRRAIPGTALLVGYVRVGNRAVEGGIDRSIVRSDGLFKRVETWWMIGAVQKQTFLCLPSPSRNLGMECYTQIGDRDVQDASRLSNLPSRL